MLGGCGAIVALLATIASTGVMLVVLVWLGRWQGLGLLAWLGTGPITATRPGERAAARLAHGFRRLSPDERSVLDPLWGQVLNRCRVPRTRWTCTCSAGVNAYAVGGRSAALTSQVLNDYRAGRIDGELLAGIMCHELGHLAARGARIRPITSWLAMPWRLFLRVVLGWRCGWPYTAAGTPRVCRHRWVHGRHRPSSEAPRVEHRRHSGSADPVLCRDADRRRGDGRAGERAADRFAIRAGHGRDLPALCTRSGPIRRAGGAYSIGYSPPTPHPTGESRVLAILCALDAGPLRRVVLWDQIGHVSDKVLTETLRRLEAHRLISRTVVASVPVEVDYSLTAVARRLACPFPELHQFAVQERESARLTIVVTSSPFADTTRP